jgi:hypothetical protein
VQAEIDARLSNFDPIRGILLGGSIPQPDHAYRLFLLDILKLQIIVYPEKVRGFFEKDEASLAQLLNLCREPIPECSYSANNTLLLLVKHVAILHESSLNTLIWCTLLRLLDPVEIDKMEKTPDIELLCAIVDLAPTPNLRLLNDLGGIEILGNLACNKKVPDDYYPTLLLLAVSQ